MSGGSVLWHVSGTGWLERPAYDGTDAYFLDSLHTVRAINGQSGQVRWKSVIDTTPGGTYGLGGCVASLEVVACGEEDIIAVHRTDGSAAWRYHATVGYSPGYFLSAALGGAIYAGSPSGTVYAIDAATGASLWVTQILPTETELISVFDPATDGDIVVAGFTKFLNPAVGGVVALEAKTGQIRWMITFPPDVAHRSGTNGRSTALWQDKVIAPSGLGPIYVLDRSTGDTAWSLPSVGKNPFGVTITSDYRSVTVVGNTLFASSLSGLFIAYDLQARSELWRLNTSVGSVNGEPIVNDGNVVFLLSASGSLVELAATTPKVLWRIGAIEDAYYAQVALGSDRIFVSRADGFYAIRK